MKLRSGMDFDAPPKDDSGEPTMWWLAVAGVLGVFFVFGAIFYIWLYIQQVQNGYRLAKLYGEHAQLLEVQRKLRLEWSRFQDPFQMEELGQKQFGLAPPGQDQKFVMH